MCTRCSWANSKNPLYLAYHDTEWGKPEHSDQKLFEMLILEGAQAGLSWETILNKRAAYQKAYKNFDPKLVAAFGESDIQELLGNPGIVRNRLKIRSSVENAKIFIQMQEEYGSFDTWLWRFLDGKVLQNQFKDLKELPAKTELSDRISKELKKKGMRFVGSTIIYSFMQAVGMVNDHIQDCFRYKELQ